MLGETMDVRLRRILVAAASDPEVAEVLSKLATMLAERCVKKKSMRRMTRTS